MALEVSQLDDILEKAKSYIWSTQKDQCYWLYAPYLGPSFASVHYLAICYLNCLNKSKFDTEKLKSILIKTQLSDGSWLQVEDENITSGNLDSTIFNYWFLKASRSLQPDHECLAKAKAFILSRGGLASSTTMTKIWLCLFGQLNWSAIANIPLYVFRDSNALNKAINVRNFVAQWVYPHVLPIAYLRHFHKQKDLGPDFDISELSTGGKHHGNSHKDTHSRLKKPSYDIENIVNKLKEIRRPLGTYGCYSVSSYFSLMCLQDWYENYPQHHSTSYEESIIFAAQLDKSIEFLDELVIDSGPSSYLGVVDDGRWWDTLLITLGLLDVGEEKEKLIPVIRHFLKEGVQECGGIAYGLDFEYCPDTDDTGVMVCILAKYFPNEFRNEIERANEWLISYQNTDGGFGAFAKGVVDWWPVKLIAGAFQNSAELFDSSSVDVTAHILEGWAASGYTLKDAHVKKAIQFIKDKQTNFGAWEGRWGCNYIYSVGAVVSALSKYNDFSFEDNHWLFRSIDWLLKHQNEDGGFGESTLSYTDSKWIGTGKSTPTQTAWAIMALIEYYNTNSMCRDAVEKAIDYLLKNFKNDKWVDSSSVGTGHRGIIFMQYPVYALAWPLIALAKYKKLQSI